MPHWKGHVTENHTSHEVSGKVGVEMLLVATGESNQEVNKRLTAYSPAENSNIPHQIRGLIKTEYVYIM